MVRKFVVEHVEWEQACEALCSTAIFAHGFTGCQKLLLMYKGEKEVKVIHKGDSGAML